MNSHHKLHRPLQRHPHRHLRPHTHTNQLTRQHRHPRTKLRIRHHPTLTPQRRRTRRPNHLRRNSISNRLCRGHLDLRSDRPPFDGRPLGAVEQRDVGNQRLRSTRDGAQDDTERLGEDADLLVVECARQILQGDRQSAVAHGRRDHVQREVSGVTDHHLGDIEPCARRVGRRNRLGVNGIGLVDGQRVE